MVGTVVGFYKGVSQKGDNFALAYVTYKDEKFKGQGLKTAECFVSDEVLKNVDDRKILNSKCEVSGSYNKKGEWRTYINSINA